MTDLPDRIVFYDGDCGFCNRTVQFVLKNDRSRSIYFAKIQSEFTQNLFKRLNAPKPDLSTFYYLENNVLYKKSRAALKLNRYMTFPYVLGQVFWIVPRFIRDWVYDLIAKRRKRIMNGYCVILSSEEVKRFI